MSDELLIKEISKILDHEAMCDEKWDHPDLLQKSRELLIKYRKERMDKAEKLAKQILEIVKNNNKKINNK